MEDKRNEFNNWLLSKVGKQSCMISRAYGEKIIQYLRDKREKGQDDPDVKSKYEPNFRFTIKKRKFTLLNVVGLGDILCLPIKDKSKATHAMLGQHRQVIFKEDMFDVIDNAHKNGDQHRGYKGTFNKINATYCSIPREVVHKFVELCDFCQKNHACFIPLSVKRKQENKDASTTPSKGQASSKAKRKCTFTMQFLTRCQIDVIDMSNCPDGSFSYIGHFVDYHTRYNTLFPLKNQGASYVAKKLCKYVFGHFGLPRILHSNLGRDFVNDVIQNVLQMWATDAQILNGNPRVRKIQPLIQQRQKTIMVLIDTIRAKQDNNNSWATWLPGIQYSLNTNQFESDNYPSYDAVYSRRPRVYTYASSTKLIPKEEDVNPDDVDEDEEHSVELENVDVDVTQPEIATPTFQGTLQNTIISTDPEIKPIVSVDPSVSIIAPVVSLSSPITDGVTTMTSQFVSATVSSVMADALNPELSIGMTPLNAAIGVPHASSTTGTVDLDSL